MPLLVPMHLLNEAMIPKWKLSFVWHWSKLCIFLNCSEKEHFSFQEKETLSAEKDAPIQQFTWNYNNLFENEGKRKKIGKCTPKFVKKKNNIQTSQIIEVIVEHLLQRQSKILYEVTLL